MAMVPSNLPRLEFRHKVLLPLLDSIRNDLYNSSLTTYPAKLHDEDRNDGWVSSYSFKEKYWLTGVVILLTQNYD